MSKSKLEYIWLDGYYPTQNMRSKTKVENDFSGKLEDCPIWSFDGSSTKQASRYIRIHSPVYESKAYIKVFFFKRLDRFVSRIFLE